MKTRDITCWPAGPFLLPHHHRCPQGAISYQNASTLLYTVIDRPCAPRGESGQSARGPGCQPYQPQLKTEQRYSLLLLYINTTASIAVKAATVLWLWLKKAQLDRHEKQTFCWWCSCVWKKRNAAFCVKYKKMKWFHRFLKPVIN